MCIRDSYYIVGFNRKGNDNPGNCNTYAINLMYDYWRDCYGRHGLLDLKQRCNKYAVREADQKSFVKFVLTRHNRGLIVWFPVEKSDNFDEIKFRGLPFDHKLSLKK